MNAFTFLIVGLLSYLIHNTGDFKALFVDNSASVEAIVPTTQSNDGERTLFEHLSNQDELVFEMSTDIKIITKNFEKDLKTEGNIRISAGSENQAFNAEFDLGGKSRRTICRFPPVKIDLKKQELADQNYVRECDRIKIVFQCNTSKSMSESIKKEKFVYDLHNLITPYGHRALLAKVRMDGKDKLYDGLILESDEDIEHRTNSTILKNRTIATTVVDRAEYVKMCLFQYMISNSDWSARKGHNTDLFKLNEDNTLIVVPYDFDYCGLIGNNYAVPPENLPISSVKQRYFMDKKITKEELLAGVEFYLQKESDIFQLVDDSTYLTNGTRKSVRKFIEGFYKIIKNEKKVKKLIN